MSFGSGNWSSEVCSSNLVVRGAAVSTVRDQKRGGGEGEGEGGGGIYEKNRTYCFSSN